MKKVITVKWLSFFLMAVLSAGFVACSSDDPEPIIEPTPVNPDDSITVDIAVYKEYIIGKWMATYSDAEQYRTIVDFKTNGTYSAVDYYNDAIKCTVHGTYALSGSALAMTNTGELKFAHFNQIKSLNETNGILVDQYDRKCYIERTTETIPEENDTVIIESANPYEGVKTVEEMNTIDANDSKRGPVSSEFSGGIGTSSNPYLISSAADLRLLSDMCRAGRTYEKKYFKMTTDIIINANVLNTDGSLNGDGANFERWIPITLSEYKYNQGLTFDGDGHTIYGLYINRPTDISNSAGLFGKANVNIKNLTIKDSYVKGKNAGAFIGWALIKYEGTSGATITNCHNYATVAGNGADGICCGSAYKIENCTNHGTIMAEINARGIGGSRKIINRCANWGTVSGGNACGIGISECIKNCFNSGSIIGGSAGSGIVSKNTSTITNNLNIGKVQAVRAGGIVQSIQGSKVYNNINLGSIEITESQNLKACGGGICNTSHNGDVQNNYFLLGTCEQAIGDIVSYKTLKNNEPLTENEMKSDSFLKELNTRAGSNSKWKTGKDGYPILEWVEKWME